MSRCVVCGAELPEHHGKGRKRKACAGECAKRANNMKQSQNVKGMEYNTLSRKAKDSCGIPLPWYIQGDNTFRRLLTGWELC